MNANPEIPSNDSIDSLTLSERLSVRIGVAAGIISVFITLIALIGFKNVSQSVGVPQQRRHPIAEFKHCNDRSRHNGF